MDISRALLLEEFKYRDLELGELGPTFPIGIFAEEEVISEFSLLPYLGKHELKLGQLEDDNQEHPNRVGRILSGFLPQIIECLGDWTIQDLAAKERISPTKLIGQMYAGDVLGLALYLRWRNWGSNLAIPDICPYCNYKINSRKTSEEDMSCHDLSTLMLRVWEQDYPPVICVPLEQRVGEIGEIYFEPLLFSQLPKLQENPEYCSDDRLLLACGRTPPRLSLCSFTPEIFNQLSRRDLRKLRQVVNLLYLGPERILDMDCPACAARWQRILTYGKDGSEYEMFYGTLLSPPRMKREAGAVEAYLNEVNYVFNYGEDAPHIDVYNVSPSTREFWLKKIKETREKQKEEMDKASAKAKAKSKSR